MGADIDKAKVAMGQKPIFTSYPIYKLRARRKREEAHSGRSVENSIPSKGGFSGNAAPNKSSMFSPPSGKR